MKKTVLFALSIASLHSITLGCSQVAAETKKAVEEKMTVEQQRILKFFGEQRTVTVLNSLSQNNIGVTIKSRYTPLSGTQNSIEFITNLPQKGRIEHGKSCVMENITLLNRYIEEVQIIVHKNDQQISDWLNAQGVWGRLHYSKVNEVPPLATLTCRDLGYGCKNPLKDAQIFASKTIVISVKELSNRDFEATIVDDTGNSATLKQDAL